MSTSDKSGDQSVICLPPPPEEETEEWRKRPRNLLRTKAGDYDSEPYVEPQPEPERPSVTFPEGFRPIRILRTR